jgi:hypothetical protein
MGSPEKKTRNDKAFTIWLDDQAKSKEARKYSLATLGKKFKIGKWTMRDIIVRELKKRNLK